MGSCNELESQLLLASDLKFIPTNAHTRLGVALSACVNSSRDSSRH
jgi:hypothetical protein